MITSRGDGYELSVEAEELDVACFRRLATWGREALADGDPHRARRLLDEALSLWRGDPLADLAYEDVAQDALRHLLDMRLAAEADHVDADLQLGRADAALVAQIESLLDQRPHDERLREQLMLALYRSGRQAEALAAYRDARALLVDDYGIEPSTRLRDLERKILRQDSTLDAPSLPAPDGVALAGGRSRRVHLTAASVAAAAAVLAAGALAIGLHPGAAASRWRGSGGQLALLGASSGGFEGAIAIGNGPSAIADDHNLAWVTSGTSGIVERVDLRHRQVTRIAVPGTPSGLAVTPGLVWVTDSSGRDVARISSRRGHVIDERDVCNGPLGIAAGLGSVWVACPLDGTLVRINPRSARILRRVPVGQSPTDVAIAAGQVWVTLESTGTVARYEPDTRTVTPIPVGSGPSAIVASGGSVWVANTLDHTVTRLDAASGRVNSVTPVGSAPEGLAAVPDGVWVAEPNARRLALLGGTPSTVRRLVSTPGAVTAVSSRRNSVLAAVSPRAGQHRGGTVRYAAGRDIVTRPDPAVSYSGDAWQILGITNDGLLTYRRTGGPLGETVVPDLAEALPRPADNGREWIFEVRRGVHYSTGRAVRAVDFRFALERDFEAGSPAAPLYADIRGAQKCRPRKPCHLSRGILIDGRTLTFRLTRPDADFPLKLAMPFADAVPAGWPAPPVNPRDAAGVVPATGPYRISGYTANRSVVLTRNARYRLWSVDAQPPGLPDKIVIEIDASARATWRRISDRTADLAPIYTTHELHILRARFPDQLVTSPLPSTSWEAVNTRRPPFDKVLVRRALAYAVDRAAAARDYAGAKPLCQILPPSFPGYTPFCPYTIAPGSRWQHPDIRHARRLIRDAQAKGAVVDLVATRGFVNDIATLRRALTRIGLRPRVITMSLAELVRRVVRSPGRFSLVSYGWTADYPAPSDFFDELFTCRSFIPHSEGNRNLSEFCSPPIDRMIRRADRLQLGDPARADRLWAAVDRAVTRQAPVIPLSSSGITTWVSPRISGFAYNPFIGVLLDQLWVRR